jgi:hypothetical protein
LKDNEWNINLEGRMNNSIMYLLTLRTNINYGNNSVFGENRETPTTLQDYLLNQEFKKKKGNNK